MKKNSIIAIILIVIAVVAIAVIINGQNKIINNGNGDVTVPEPAVPVQAGLPEAVAEKREAIARAAQNRSFEELASLASPIIRYTFGVNTEGGFEDDLRQSEENYHTSPFDLIPKLLSLPYAHENDLYVWPGLFLKTADEWTEEDIEHMRTLISDEEIEGYRQFGAYIGYRIAINENGEWVYYLAGD